MISQDKILSVFNTMKDQINDPNTMANIRSGFDSAFGKVKGRLGDSWEDVQAIYEMVMDADFTVETKYKLVLVGSLFYLVSPVDLIPESRFGPLGLADDVAVLLFAVNYARPEIARYQAQKTTPALADDSSEVTPDA